jgi:periplasmic divalent cation tolerance protein
MTDGAESGTDAVVVVSTTDSAEEAERLARGLVAARLAACVQVVGPVRSVFRWGSPDDDGAADGIQVEQEWQLVVKTAADRVDDLTRHLVAEHSYDVPEVIAVPITGGHGPYLQWVADETRQATS